MGLLPLSPLSARFVGHKGRYDLQTGPGQGLRLGAVHEARRRNEMIRREDVLPLFEELDKKAKTIPIHAFGMVGEKKAHEMRAFQAWMGQAEAAIDGVFPPTHAIRTRWAKAEQSLKPFNDGAYVVGDVVIGAFEAAVGIIQSDRLGSLLDVVRNETENELLGQAETLLKANHKAAAAVIAGGALEVHLRSLCEKFGLTVSGDGSISKYDGAIAKARNDGVVTVYPATDSKLVGAWGGMRNDAAHDPGAFSNSKEDVRRMIEGVRDFIPRTS
ncbi:MAG: hypothetical protein ACYCS7_03815 [Acidimicrobiales bacterium]